MTSRRENPHKKYVKVRADHMISGQIIPRLFKEDDGPTVRIDRIVDVREAPSLKAGGQGIRYTCQIEDCQIYLFYEEPYWFLEA